MKKIECDSIIFDMDGVLISNDSYNQAIIKTVEFFLSANDIRVEVSTDDIYTVKKIRGFNNDWDVSFALIEVLEKNISQRSFHKYIKKISPETRESSRYQQIKDIFGSFYLGADIFQEIYQRPAPIKISTGLMEEEEMLIDINILSHLSSRYKLAIATSRPRFEALFAAKFQKISPAYFGEESIVAKEDCQKEKPFPDPLLEAQKRINGKNSVYIGDTVNDVLAAKSAGMVCIYVGEENIGDLQVTNVNEIKEIFSYE